MAGAGAAMLNHEVTVGMVAALLWNAVPGLPLHFSVVKATSLCLLATLLLRQLHYLDSTPSPCAQLP